MNNADEWISDLENRIMEITQSGEQTENQIKKKRKKERKKASIRDLWDNIRSANLHKIGIPEGEEKEKGVENIFEKIMAWTFPNQKETDMKIQMHRGPPSNWTQTGPHQGIFLKKWQKLKGGF